MGPNHSHNHFSSLSNTGIEEIYKNTTTSSSCKVGNEFSIATEEKDEQQRKKLTCAQLHLGRRRAALPQQERKRGKAEKAAHAHRQHAVILDHPATRGPASWTFLSSLLISTLHFYSLGLSPDFYNCTEQRWYASYVLIPNLFTHIKTHPDKISYPPL